ncbi:GDP-fucose transporter 1 [Trifolium repens]|nr:GDP-fucose transporter 1 [Trifolium repens]
MSSSSSIIKQHISLVMNLGLNTWSFVLFNNVLSLMIAPVFWFLTGENFEVFTAIRSSTGSLFELNAFLAVSLSCVFGLLISFFGFAARKAVSATAFTVTGVVNKFLTVAINVTIWDKHASPAGLVCLLFTIVGGVLYQQSVTGNVLQQRDAVVVTKQTDVESSLVGDSDDESEGKGKHASL